MPKTPEIAAYLFFLSWRGRDTSLCAFLVLMPPSHFAFDYFLGTYPTTLPIQLWPCLKSCFILLPCVSLLSHECYVWAEGQKEAFASCTTSCLCRLNQGVGLFPEIASFQLLPATLYSYTSYLYVLKTVQGQYLEFKSCTSDVPPLNKFSWWYLNQKSVFIYIGHHF